MINKDDDNFVDLFNDLLNKIRSKNLKIKIDNVLEFITLFRTSDINLFLEYNNDVKSKGFIDTEGLSKLLTTYLGLDKIDGHEIEIATFLCNNVINGYYYHLTNQIGLENIKKNGMNVTAKSDLKEDILELQNSFSPESNKKLLPLATRDADCYSISFSPCTNRVSYGNVPEWFQIFTGGFFNKDSRNYDKAKEYILGYLNQNGDNELAKKMATNILNKYWGIYSTNMERTLVLIPAKQILNFDTNEIISDKENIKKYPKDFISAFLMNYFLPTNVQVKTYVAPEYLTFINLEKLEIEKNKFNTK